MENQLLESQPDIDAAMLAAGAVAIVGREYGERAVTDELQNVAALLVDRRDDDVGIVVEKGNDVLRRRVGDPREAAQIADLQHGIDVLGVTSDDPAAQHPAAGVASEIGLHQRAGHPGQRDGLDGECEKRREAL